MDNYLGEGQGELGMKKLREAAVLLSLGTEASEERGLGFYEAEEEIFASNERARAALEQLGLLILTETEARNVMGHRIDVSS